MWRRNMPVWALHPITNNALYRLMDTTTPYCDCPSGFYGVGCAFSECSTRVYRADQKIRQGKSGGFHSFAQKALAISGNVMIVKL